MRLRLLPARLPHAVELSLLMDGDQVDAWFRDTSTGQILYAYRQIDEAAWIVRQAVTFTNPSLSSVLFPCVFQVGATYYMVVTDSACKHLWLYSSTDKVTWAGLNGGNPVYGAATGSGAWNSQMFNAAIAVVEGVWHLLIEAKSSTSNFHVGYGKSTLAAGPDFGAWMSSGPVLPDSSGNPCLISVPERHAVMAIYGDLSGGHWVLRARTADISYDLTQAASWVEAPGFLVSAEGVHLSDPAILFTPRGRCLLGFTSAQRDGRFAVGDLTPTEFYDQATLTAPAEPVIVLGR